MYTTRHLKPLSSTTLQHSRSSDNFYRRAVEKTLKHLPSPNTSQSSQPQCLACKHEQRQVNSAVRPLPLGLNLYTSKAVSNEYYKTNEKDELNNLKKAKRYLEQLLERSKTDLKKSAETYERKLKQMEQEIKDKDQEIFQLQKAQLQREAEQYCLSNASLVQTYKTAGKMTEEEDELRTRRLKQLMKNNDILQNQLLSAHQLASDRLDRLQVLEMDIVRMREFQTNAKEYESMKILIEKMQEQKLSLLDRQHAQMQQFQANCMDEKESLQSKLQQLNKLFVGKSKELQCKDEELKILKRKFTMYRDEQYQTLKELLDDRQKECHTLQSRLNCLQAELSFIQGKYGYILKVAQSNQMIESRAQEQDEYCIQRVGRYQVSNGKESLISMNLSPIKRR